ncbi:nuclear pore complex protein Nup88 [Elysia marginata]|uniref:Nuclear pore complex protein Nup88 n=1 Tax=Elysia marginata TaxID=1093978 RepID=A0AAV4FKK1_9GAST|nr:nuclear pore complex protein Nup88 [Elysia marginata]
MAAACAEFNRWRTVLNNHSISLYLRKQAESGTSRPQNKDTKSLICLQSSDLFIWCASEGCILHCNLKSFPGEETETDLESESTRRKLGTIGAASSFVPTSSFQKLFPGDVLSLEVESIGINKTGSHLLLYGARGIRVLELPRRWGKNAVFEGGKETVRCKTVRIGDRMLTRSSSLRILQVSWHPGSKTNSHLAVLTSDNRFCVYSIIDSDQPVSSVLINEGDRSLNPTPSKNFVGAALGEVAVAFDFSMPIMLQPRQRILSGSSGISVSGSVSPIEVWPVYCVRGNGAIMLVYSHLSNIKPVNLPVQGPLVMYPPADDNYGVDACSILCLPTPVPVLVISTCEGRLHHCVQLPSSDNDLSQHNESASSVNLEKTMLSSTGLYEAIPEPTLYVIETAVLELCLSVPQIDDQPGTEDEFMCPVLLRKDGNSCDRYHCSHAAGVHSVALPWLTSVLQYFLEDKEDSALPEENECIVEHVLCTKPLYSCPTSPILGLDVVTDPLLGASLVVLSSDLEFTVLPLGLQYQVMSPSENATTASGTVSESFVSRQRNSAVREPFSRQLEQILQRKSSIPILKSGGHAELSQQDMYQFLSRVTSVLREEYIHKQDHARQELHTRVAMLQQRKDHQLQDIKALLDSRHLLRDNATAISEKLEKCKDDHESLLKRLENSLRKVQSRVPVLSEAERQEMKELNAIKSNMDLYKQNIDQVRVKQEYQERQIKRAGGHDSPALHQKQISQIKNILQDENSDIEELKKDVNRLSLDLS